MSARNRKTNKKRVTRSGKKKTPLSTEVQYKQPGEFVSITHFFYYLLGSREGRDLVHYSQHFIAEPNVYVSLVLFTRVVLPCSALPCLVSSCLVSPIALGMDYYQVSHYNHYTSKSQES